MEYEENLLYITKCSGKSIYRIIHIRVNFISAMKYGKKKLVSTILVVLKFLDRVDQVITSYFLFSSFYWIIHIMIVEIHKLSNITPKFLNTFSLLAFIKSVIIGNKRLTLFFVHLVGFHIVVRELDFEYDRNLYGPSHNIHLHHQLNNIGGFDYYYS